MHTANLQGIWLPLITPFRNGEIDEQSVRRLLHHYAAQPIDGLILAATTGEGMTLDETETEYLVRLATAELHAVSCAMPVYLGLCGSDTRKLLKAIDLTEDWEINGYLIACPYYTRPSQDGLIRHFTALAAQTAKPILIYNIPYRTGVNLGNTAMRRLAEISNIAGVKDCSADLTQSCDLLHHRPAGFSVLTGEDALFHTMLANGADGGVLASAHIETRAFAVIRSQLIGGDQAGALSAWRGLSDLPHLLFTEPSPAPIKHWLWRTGLIHSPELRLPMTGISDALAARLDTEIARRGAACLTMPAGRPPC